LGQPERVRSLSPPPVESANVYAATLDAAVRVLYMSYDVFRGSGGGVVLTYGLSDEFALSANVGRISMSGEYSGMAAMRVTAIPWGAYAVYEMLGGNDRDPAGQITRRQPTLSIFGGTEIIPLSMSLDMDMDEDMARMAGVERHMDYSETDVFVEGGGLFDVPLADWLSAVPFGSLMLGKTRAPGVTRLTNLGLDILVRPFRNDPNWEVSVGTVWQQVEANTRGSHLIMAGLSYTLAPHFTRTRVGPVLK
jgi:hypothetical protein